LTKIKTKIGYNPKIDLRTGIKRFIQWAVDENNIQSPLLSILQEKKILNNYSL